MKRKRAVLYARVSGDDSANDGRNLIGQLNMCREYAKEQNYVIVADLAEDDRGASGAEIDLPQSTGSERWLLLESLMCWLCGNSTA